MNSNVLALFAVLFAAGTWAGITQGWPHLDHPFPKGAAPGETIQIELRGNNLLNPVDLLFYHPGFEVVRFLEPKEKGEKFKDLDGRDRPWDVNRRVVCELRIPKDAPLGEHHFRIATEGGLSQMRTFWLGAFPSVREDENPSYTEDDRKYAQEVALGKTINGVLHRFDLDIYKFALKKNQRFTAEIEGYRLASWENRGVADLQLNLVNEAGKEIASAYDSHVFLADPVLTTVIPADDTYYLRVKSEFPTAAGRNLPYRLHVGDFVRPTAIHPSGAQAGEKVSVKVFGDPKGEFTHAFTVPKDAPADYPLLAARDGKTPPTPTPFRVSQGKSIVEAEPNNSTSAPNKGGDAFPIAFNGVIEKAGDVDCFRFSTKGAKGPVRIRVHAQNMNSALDARIALYRVTSKDGKEKLDYVKTYEDAKAAELDYIRIDNQNRILLDPVVSVTSKTEWVMTIVDTHKRGGPEFTYRIEIEPIVPHVHTYLKSFYNQHYTQTRNRICIPSGNRISTEVDIRPAYGFKHDCALRLEALDLPPGVTMYAPIIPKGQTKAPVVFEAAEGTLPLNTLIDIIAVPLDEEKSFTSGFQQCNTFTTIQNGYGLWHTKSHKLALAVLEPAPYRLTVETPKIDLLHDGEINLLVTIDRDEGFDHRVELNMDWYLANTSKASSVKLEKDQKEARFRISANSRAEVGDYQFAIYAHSGGGNTRSGEKLMYTGTEHVPVRVAPAYIKANFVRGKIGRGTIGTVKVKFEHLREFDGETRIKLRNFPRGVKASEEWFPINAETKEIDFPIECATDALMGMSRGLGCILEIKKPNGGVMQQKSGYGYLRIDPQRAKTVAAK